MLEIIDGLLDIIERQAKLTRRQSEIILQEGIAKEIREPLEKEEKDIELDKDLMELRMRHMR